MNIQHLNASIRMANFRVVVAAICNILLAFLLFSLTRFIFFVVNHEYFAELTTSQLLQIFRGGLVFDTSAIIYLNSLYILMMMLPIYYKEKESYQLVAKIIFIVTNSAGMVMNLMDTVYFRFTNRRTTASVFAEFQHEDNLWGIISGELFTHWYLTLMAVVLVVALWKAYRKPFGQPALRNIWVYTGIQCVCMAAIVPLCIAGMRGGIGRSVRPITISNANRYVDRPIDCALVLNTPFSVIRTLGKQTFKVPAYYPDEQTLSEVYSPVFQPNDSVPFQPLNVVVLILESFSQEYIDEGYAPFLDSLMRCGMTYEHSFANGRKSIDGMPSILSSIPMFIEPFFLTPASLNKVSGIAGCLNSKGYQTAFFHGAPNGSMGFDAFARATGFAHYYGMTEFDADPEFDGDAAFDGSWAIWDEEFFQYYAKQMSAMQQPFATAVFSASSHHPFVVPDKYKGVFPKGTMPMHQCIGYSDYALRRFFETASRQPWYQNTLFVITADHTNMMEKPENLTSVGLFRVPVCLYRPDNSLAVRRQGIAQQIDIMPTVLGYLHYDRPYVAFGCDLWHTPDEQTNAVNYLNGVYQYFYDHYVLLFDGHETTALYDFVGDPLLRHDLKGAMPEVQTVMECKLKGIIQQYMVRMVTDELVFE